MVSYTSLEISAFLEEMLEIDLVIQLSNKVAEGYVEILFKKILHIVWEILLFLMRTISFILLLNYLFLLFFSSP